MLIYVKTKRDVRGNPRRGWIVAFKDELIFVDEGYLGRWSLYGAIGLGGGSMEAIDKRQAFNKDCNEVTLEVTVSQYNDLKRGIGL